MEEERCAVFLTMDRVGSSILATIQPLYKYRRESPLVPRGAGARVYVRAPLPAYYSTRFVISSSSSSPPCCFCTSLSLSLFFFRAPSLPLFLFSFSFECQLELFAIVNRPQTAIRHISGHWSQN